MRFTIGFILFFLFTSNIFAFDMNKCSKVMSRVGPWGFFTTSGQFTSSTGGCAMIGLNSNDKKVFIAHNLDMIQSDSARGDGEYLMAYAFLLGCNETGSLRLKKALKSNFGNIFGNKDAHTAKKTYKQIEDLISNDLILKESCHVRT